MVEVMHIVTLTDKDKRYGLVPYLVGRIHGKGEAEPLYADKPGPDGKIQIAKAFATPVGGRVGPRGKFKVPWRRPLSSEQQRRVRRAEAAPGGVRLKPTSAPATLAPPVIL